MIDSLSMPTALFAILVLLAILLLIRWQKNHPLIDLSDLITGDNGRVSGSKFCQMGAWVVSTWGFATMVQQGKMTEWYMLVYMTVWAGYAAIKSGALSPSTITYSQTSTSQQEPVSDNSRTVSESHRGKA